MKAQVYNCGGLWYGRVYADWWLGGKRWRTVTDGCLTRIGATAALKYWFSQNKVYNIKI